MMRRTAAVLLFTIASVPVLTAQDGYRQPPADIAAMLDARPTPSVSLSPDRRWMLVMDRPGMPSIAEVAEPHLKLAGSRINPRTNATASTFGYTGFTLLRIRDRAETPVAVPAGGRLGGPDWSPDGSRFAFTLTEENGVSLHVADTAGQVRRLLGPTLNGTHGSPCQWVDAGRALLCATIPATRGAAPAATAVPTGPVIQETSGKGAPGRTYQDLLSSPEDEALFEHYFQTQYVRVALDGTTTPVGPAGMVVSLSPSPDGEWYLAETIQRPFSYQFPWYNFPSRTEIWRADGTVAKVLKNQREVEVSPIARGSVLPGPRAWRWREDAPATLVWVEALDGGDPAANVDKRDRVLAMDAPFSGTPVTLLETAWRAGGITWGRADLALASESWSPTRMTRTWVIDPSRPGSAPRLLWERSSQDRYNDPGSPLTRETPDGRRLLHFSRDGRALWLSGAGASPEGDRPFLDRMEIATGKTTRLFRSTAPYYETIVGAIDADAGRFITRRESRTEPANYFQRDLVRRMAPVQLTNVADPAPAFAGITSRLITYHRKDGVQLSGTLYLPQGYDAARDGPLPFLLWAYPTEFTSAADASQVSGSPYRFTRPGGSSHLFMLTQGYGILDDPSFPIIGADGAEPNDTYVEQLVASAEAAIDTLVAMGVGDRERMAVGGHSYGAFMTANLLAHSRLFKAGIARSGAYNRSLTPFGFQAEPRSYWEAMPVYLRMSPFTYANQVKDAILFTHGMDDNNSGTFPIQSERMYAAVKGHGGTARLVMLPGESHGYAARESVGHVLAEMTEWLDRHVKTGRPSVP
ncbi:MAG TPA: prolyl oligopeptidase family serine peptidase [Gemmatimonadales bacterium]|nr:prolyl oligopeptidase family serine peptidase [Gemmatimonadales bacterium]